MQKVLYFKPVCGLCNRWRAFLSVIGASTITGHRIKLFWQKQPDCCAELEDLWEDYPADKITEEEFKEEAVVVNVNEYRSRVVINNYTKVKITSGADFRYPGTFWYDHYNQMLRPNKNILQRVQDFYESNLEGKKCVSILARFASSAHELSLNTSPQEWFLEKAKREIASGTKRILIATDVMGFTDWMNQQLGDTYCVEIERTTYERENTSIAIEGMINVLLMEKTPVVYSSYYSSMGYMPQMLNPKIKVITPVKTYTPKA